MWPWAAWLVVALAAPLCLGLTRLGAQRLDLFHAAVFNSCAIRAHELHWQNPGRYPERIRYDFTGSPVSFALVVVWIEDGPTLTFSHHLPLRCSSASAIPTSSGDPRGGGLMLAAMRLWPPSR